MECRDCVLTLCLTYRSWNTSVTGCSCVLGRKISSFLNFFPIVSKFVQWACPLKKFKMILRKGEEGLKGMTEDHHHNLVFPIAFYKSSEVISM